MPRGGKPRPIEYYVNENGCHICTSHPSGSTRVNGKAMTIHNYIYRTKVGEIPDGMLVTRTCKNTRCINPEHLTLVTKKDLAIQNNPIDFDVDPVTGCFNCTSHPVDSRGYHTIWFNRKPIKIHRFIYEQMFGVIPEGLIVRHKCDNPHCINPEHLELGTHADNMRDRDERGRTARGSRQGLAKLTEDDVREIRKRLAAGEGVNYLARIYGVHHKAISLIKQRKTWKHVD